jgi:hypothetical protein
MTKDSKSRKAEKVVDSQTSQIGETAAPSQDPQPSQKEKPSQPSQPSEAQPSQVSQELEARIREVVRDELILHQAIIARPDRSEFPARPKEKPDKEAKETTPKGKKPPKARLAGQKHVLPGCVIDQVLFDMFEARREDRNVSASRLMEEILWVYFDRPRLSFERPQREAQGDK